MQDCVVLLMPTTTYKAQGFVDAATRLNVDVLVGADRHQALESAAPEHTLTVDLRRPEHSVATIVARVGSRRVRAVVGTDDETTILAAMAAAAMGLPHNPVDAVRATRNKYAMRLRLSAAGLRGPAVRRFAVSEDPERAARQVAYPCVLKPLALSASRGVIRADDPGSFVDAFHRVTAILERADARDRGNSGHLLVEDYLPGDEFALEGLLTGGQLRLLALFDKPDPLSGPFFEETLFITPSCLPDRTRDRVVREVELGCRALGLREGPVHAEIRLHEGEPWLLEIAPRSIGGLCARALRFGAGMSLEELILRHAVGHDLDGLSRESAAAGVMMIPIPRAGVLRDVDGLERARSVPGVDEVTLTTHRGAELVPLPEGHRYLGFIFARGDAPQAVEHALRQAHALLRFDVEAPRDDAGRPTRLDRTGTGP